VTVYLKDGACYPQTIVLEGTITTIRHHNDIPFTLEDIDHLKVTHDKWDWDAERNS